MWNTCELSTRVNDLLPRFPALQGSVGKSVDQLVPTEYEWEVMESLRIVAAAVSDLAQGWSGRGTSLHANPLVRQRSPLLPWNRRHREQAFRLLQQPIEQQIADFLVHLASGHCHEIVYWLASELTASMRELAACQTRVSQGLANPPLAVRQHAQSMREARMAIQQAGGDAGTMAVQWINEIVRRKQAQGLRRIGLTVFHDVDDSLIDGYRRYAPLVPLHYLKRLSADAIDQGCLARSRVRMTILAGLARLPVFATGLQIQTRQVASQSNWFVDAFELLHKQHPLVKHNILSANFDFHAQAVLGSVTATLERFTLKSHSYRGPEKFLTIADYVLKHPERVVMVVDDSDARLVKALDWERDAAALQIEDLVIFCARHDPENPSRFPLKAALDRRQIIHAANLTGGNGREHNGYGGAVGIIDAFTLQQS